MGDENKAYLEIIARIQELDRERKKESPKG